MLMKGPVFQQLPERPSAAGLGFPWPEAFGLRLFCCRDIDGLKFLAALLPTIHWIPNADSQYQMFTFACKRGLTLERKGGIIQTNGR
jgi:hypothetical protein